MSRPLSCETQESKSKHKVNRERRTNFLVSNPGLLMGHIALAWLSSELEAPLRGWKPKERKSYFRDQRNLIPITKERTENRMYLEGSWIDPWTSPWYIIKSKFLSLEPAPMGSHCFLMPVLERVTGWAHPDLPAASTEPLSFSQSTVQGPWEELKIIHQSQTLTFCLNLYPRIPAGFIDFILQLTDKFACHLLGGQGDIINFDMSL